MTVLNQKSSIDHQESRSVAAIVGLIMSVVGYGLALFKLVVHQHHINTTYGLHFGTNCWHMAVMSSGLLLGGLGTALFLKAMAGRWNWR
jgi:hypothetical protein